MSILSLNKSSVTVDVLCKVKQELDKIVEDAFEDDEAMLLSAWEKKHGMINLTNELLIDFYVLILQKRIDKLSDCIEVRNVIDTWLVAYQRERAMEKHNASTGVTVNV